MEKGRFNGEGEVQGREARWASRPCKLLSPDSDVLWASRGLWRLPSQAVLLQLPEDNGPGPAITLALGMPH